MNKNLKIGIGCDHGGFALKNKIAEYLKKDYTEVVDYGTYSSKSVDYPVYAKLVANAVASGEVDRGIIVCGSGVGVSICANKVKGIRAVVCSAPNPSAQNIRDFTTTPTSCVSAKESSAR